MRIAVVGGGPAGMMAAIAAGEQGADVTLFDGNEKLGKKLYITGKGRCNVTNNADSSEFFKNIPLSIDNTTLLALWDFLCPVIIRLLKNLVPTPAHTDVYADKPYIPVSYTHLVIVQCVIIDYS